MHPWVFIQCAPAENNAVSVAQEITNYVACSSKKKKKKKTAHKRVHQQKTNKQTKKASMLKLKTCHKRRIGDKQKKTALFFHL